MHKKISTILLSLCLLGSSAFAQKISVNLKDLGPELSPYLYGIFFEDINYGADGGLNADLVQNGSFEYSAFYDTYDSLSQSFHPMYAWEKVARSGGEGQIYISTTSPLHRNNPNNLEIVNRTDEGLLGVSNSGFDGIFVEEGKQYNFSTYAWIVSLDPLFFMTNPKMNLKVVLEDENGGELDSFTWNESSLPAREWTSFTATLTPNRTCRNARLSVLTQGKMRVKLDMVSLMPEDTFNGHGLRKDLVQALYDLHPGVMRFPGGCIVHGFDLDNQYNWKDTVGPKYSRRMNWNKWGYFQSYALGYYEYFQLCEDIGAMPLPVLPVGVTCIIDDYEGVPLEEMDSYIQDALDLVEFANGDTSTKWGKVRSDMGHPEPFGLKYIALGNEEYDQPALYDRYPRMVEAFQKAYPDIRIVGTSGMGSDGPLYKYTSSLGVWSSDEHNYEDPEWFVEQQFRFDTLDRSKPKIFEGEYASNGNKMRNAAGEAAFLTGVERNGDMVEMATYAPLFARYGHIQWSNANMIYFNGETRVLTPDYYVQKMFSNNKGDVYINHTKTSWPGKDLSVSTTLDRGASCLIVKVANTSSKAENLSIALSGIKGVKGKATLTLLSADPEAENTLSNPDNVTPVEKTLSASSRIKLSCPACSVQVLRIPVSL